MTAPVPRVDRLAIASEPSTGERPLIGALQVVWRGKWIIVACLLVSFLVGLYRASKVVPVYSAHAKLVLQQAPSMLDDKLTVRSQSGGYLVTQCEIIHSTVLLQKALAEPGVADTSVLKASGNPVAFLKTAVLAGVDSEGEAITVGMDSTSAEDAATIVNGVVSAYIKYLSEQHRAYAMDVLKVLQGKVKEQEADLAKEQQKVTDFKKLHPELALQSDKGRGDNPFSRDLEEAKHMTICFKFAVEAAGRIKDDRDADDLKSELDQACAETKMPLETQPVFDPALADESRALEKELEHLEPGNPLYKHDTQLLGKKQRQIQIETIESSQRYRALLAEKLREAEDRQDTYQKLYDVERAKAIDVNSSEADLDHIEDQIQDTSRELEVLNSQIKSLNVSEDEGMLTASVIEPASPSTETIGSGRSKVLGMSVVMGLMLGLGGSLLLEMVDQRFRSVDQISRTLSLPILGSVPHIDPGTGWSLPRSIQEFRANIRGLFNLPARLSRSKQWKITQQLMECGQVMQLQPRSDIAEAYRTIRTAIYFGLSGAPAKTILITSPSSGDGKTTLASNLAISIAQASRRVLLIDADCWRPTQHTIFDLPEQDGLTAVLLKKITLTQAVRKTAVANLDVLPCGELPSNPAELLESQALVDLLAEASEIYDQILIDSPPVVPITDARVLAASCGATILVLRAGKSTRGQADQAFEALASVGAPILGVVVNDAQRSVRGKSYQYYRYAGDRTDRWNGYQTNGNGNGHRNGNGYSKHLVGPVVEAEEVIDDEQS